MRKRDVQGYLSRLTCAHVLNLASHAHDQASVRKAIDELLASAFIFGGRNSRSEFSWFDCAYEHVKCQRKCQRSVYRVCRGSHRDVDGISE